jgi:hypothetical protein
MNRFTIVFVVSAIVTDTVTYAAIAAFGLAILKGLRKTKKDMSSRTGEWVLTHTISLYCASNPRRLSARMQKQMNTILAVQAITPIFTATIPVAIMVAQIFLKINIRGSGIVISMLLSWVCWRNVILRVVGRAGEPICRSPS